ncbi:MAG: OB-fold nucleic acid binding domain-containing protein [Candidatus Nanopelagicales bacterium]
MTAESTWRARTSTGQQCAHVRMCDAEVGEVVEVSGTVHSVTLHPSGGVESFEADISDQTGIVHLVWLGRRRLTGIVPSRQISARGRVAFRNGRKVIFNPEYELMIPSAG